MNGSTREFHVKEFAGMATDALLMTADRLLAMPADGYRYEILRGELIQMSPAKRRHGSVGELFGVYLGYHIATLRLGEVYLAETGFLLTKNPDTVRAPDFAFIRQERLEQISGNEGYIPIPPDLCMEVISPNDRPAEIEQKVRDWLDFGTRIVVVINPKTRLVSVYRSPASIEFLTERDILRLEELVPGWSLLLAEIFR
jgi:Uma2 family endonuclease